MTPRESSDPELESRIRELLANGKKIAAVKLYREQTRAGLAQAKDAVETLESGGRLPIPEQMAANWEPEVLQLVAEGKKIEAIKTYREATGASLMEAKQVVDSLAAGEAAPLNAASNTNWESDVLRLLTDGKKIQAIKRYRQHHGVGLKESRLAVEELARRHGIVTGGSGCFGIVCAILAISVGSALGVMVLS